MSGSQQILLGGTGFAPVVRVYQNLTTTDTIPNLASNLIIEVWGNGNAGGTAGSVAGGGGGGAGGYSRSSFALTPSNWGQTINFSAPVTNGSACSASSGTFTLTTMTANGGTVGGNNGAAGGAGGSAVGGTAANTTGGTGGNHSGGTGGSGGTPITGTVTGDGSPYGGGGAGGNAPSGAGSSGAAGAVVFYYT